MPNTKNLVKSYKLRVNCYQGFTLVELLVVMAIIGILITLVAASFRSAQARGRDAERKSDLKNIANSMELFLSDHGRYPDADANGEIVGCPYPTGNCSWGTSEFTDGNTTYFKMLPKDPSVGQRYYYRLVPGSNNQKFQIFAHLENTRDQDCLGGDCANPPVTYSCGSATCNFAITSANTKPTEQ